MINFARHAKQLAGPIAAMLGVLAAGLPVAAGAADIGHALYQRGAKAFAPTDAAPENAMWFLKLAQELSVSRSVQVVLAGGVLPQSIYWAAVGAASLDTNSTFKGTTLAPPSGAIMKAGTTGQGKTARTALARKNSDTQ